MVLPCHLPPAAAKPSITSEWGVMMPSSSQSIDKPEKHQVERPESQGIGHHHLSLLLALMRVARRSGLGVMVEVKSKCIMCIAMFRSCGEHSPCNVLLKVSVHHQNKRWKG